MRQTQYFLALCTSAVALLCCSLLSSCQPFRMPEMKLPYKLPVHVLRWENNMPIIRIETHCYNQNSAGFTFRGGKIDMYLDTFYLGHAVIDTSFDVAAKSPFMVPAQLKIDIVPMINHGLKLDSVVAVRVDGEMSGSTLGIKKTFPIHVRENHMIELIMKPF